MTSSNGRDTGYTRQNFSVITNARIATSDEMSSRVKSYSITMAFRTACFIAMIFVPGVWRWILFAGAVFLPYIAVLLANQAHQRSSDKAVETGAPADAKQLTTDPEGPDLIPGQLVESDEQRETPQHVRFR